MPPMINSIQELAQRVQDQRRDQRIGRLTDERTHYAQEAQQAAEIMEKPCTETEYRRASAIREEAEVKIGEIDLKLHRLGTRFYG